MDGETFNVVYFEFSSTFGWPTLSLAGLKERVWEILPSTMHVKEKKVCAYSAVLIVEMLCINSKII